MEFDASKFDIRVIERNLQKGRITFEEYDAYLNSLPDVAELAEPLEPEGSSSAAQSQGDRA